jgi:hypothetical protein
MVETGTKKTFLERKLSNIASSQEMSLKLSENHMNRLDNFENKMSGVEKNIAHIE